MPTVYAFDRDDTVDVNPHPEKDAVPLEWLIQLHTHEERVVWAIGNQRLTHEAAIPGLVELQIRLGEAGLRARALGFLTWLDGLLRSHVADKLVPASLAAAVAEVVMPARRDRLRLLERLFPTADAYIVVDDADLSDVDGWEHHFPWEFYREFRDAFAASSGPAVTPAASRRSIARAPERAISRVGVVPEFDFHAQDDHDGEAPDEERE